MTEEQQVRIQAQQQAMIDQHHEYLKHVLEAEQHRRGVQ